MTRLTLCVPLFFSLLIADTPRISAAPIVAFSTIPAGGFIIDPQGSTGGWGYTISNADSSLWVAVNSLNSSAAFFGGILDTSIFDFPVIGPGQTLAETYITGVQGLAQFSWNRNVPPGSQNAGSFLLGLIWYTQNPDTCGYTCTFAGPGQQTAVAPYLVTVNSPEPDARTMTAGAFVVLALIFIRRRCRAVHESLPE